MSPQCLPEDMEYRQRLKWGSEFQYNSKDHSRSDVTSEGYFNNVAVRFSFSPGDRIHVVINHLDGSWSRGLFEVISVEDRTATTEQVGDWHSAGGTRVDKKAVPAPIAKKTTTKKAA